MPSSWTGTLHGNVTLCCMGTQLDHRLTAMEITAPGTPFRKLIEPQWGHGLITVKGTL
jgi:hypothetical protein